MVKGIGANTVLKTDDLRRPHSILIFVFLMYLNYGNLLDNLLAQHGWKFVCLFGCVFFFLSWLKILLGFKHLVFGSDLDP